MCLILVKPKDKILPKGLFKNLVTRNKDGFGYMFVDKNKKIITNKTHSGKWEEHWEMFEPHQDKHIALHWRLKTQGAVDHENTHPFEVIPEKLYMMHNGGIYGIPEKDIPKDRSDTYIFVKNFLQPYLEVYKNAAKDLKNNPIMRAMMAKMVGENNKLMFLDQENFFFLNTFYVTDESYIEEMQGLIFSNQYAWDNQYWYKTANKNQYNEEYVKGTTYSYSQNNSDPYENLYNSRRHHYHRYGQTTKETTATKEIGKDSKTTSKTEITGKQTDKVTTNGNSGTKLIRNTLHLKKKNSVDQTMPQLPLLVTKAA